MRVLAIEDNRPFLKLLRNKLKKHGFVVDEIGTLEDGMALALDAGYDAILLKSALPNGDGKQLLDHVRRARKSVPIIIVSARGAISERIALLHSGADDYLVKPIDFGELASRIHTVVRRSAGRGEVPEISLAFADIAFEQRKRVATVKGLQIKLRPRETALLEILLRRAGEPVHREVLVSNLYSIDEEIGSNVVNVYVHHLRRRLADAGTRATIATVRGFGYALLG